MRKPAIARISLGALAAAVCALASLGIPASAAAASTPPTIESESVSNITQTDAVLEADINPGGLATHYQFHLAYGCGFEGEACPQFCISGQPCPGPWNSVITVPLPSGDLPASTEIQHVSLDLNEAGVTLQPYKYRYSVEATNAAGTAVGPDQFFTPASSPPPPIDSPPSIESESVSHLTPSNATLEAEINPHGASAGVFYQFQLLLDPGEAPTEMACPSSPPSGYSVCVGPQDPTALPLGWVPGNETKTVSLDLSSAGVTLTPGRTYYFRVLTADRVFSEDTAEWEPPAVVGPSEDFTTPTSPSISPSILSESATDITNTDATLEAEVNLHEAAAGVYYQFQLVGDPGEYASEILCPPTLQPGIDGCIGPQGSPALPIGFLPGNTLQPSATSHASLDLASAGVTLQPVTTYHYRVLVARAVQTEDTIEWEAPTVFGPDQTFTTSSESPRAIPLSAQDSTGVQPLSTTTPAVASHRHHHAGLHKRRRHRVALHRASRAG